MRAKDGVADGIMLRYRSAPPLPEHQPMSSLRTSVRFPWLPLLAALLAGAGCASSGTSHEGTGKGDGKDDEKDDELTELKAKIDVAKLELDLARLESEQELDGAERELAEAKLKAEKARIEREGFAALGRARELDEAKLGVDRSRGRAEDAAAELAELESMYSKEEFATKTKELVITRSRRDLEHAKRALDLSERQLKETEGFELIGKERALEQANLEGEKGVVEAEQALTKKRLEKQIAIAKAEQELAELMRKAEKEAKKKEKEKEKKGKEKGEGVKAEEEKKEGQA
jgi:hypothetical protein